MITERPPFGALRAREYRGPLRILWLALLVISLMYAHGLYGENPAHHLSSTAFSTANSGHSSAESHGGPGAGTGSSPGHAPHGSDLAHPDEQCMPGQPQLTVSQQVSGSDGLGQSTLRDRTAERAQPVEGSGVGSSPACPRTSGILRI
ncbi:hypothetical protein GCM10010387_03670 [Streptomyces inusitatus]|uniref:Uncharacterized protein n=2 Tax=Streptomyces inusitatus TaxID=68221 RepID=A0A918PMH5_9ACTN|nr:hypothetical protein GCM10010387_03670 [Streptomyces inusitatus]